MTARFSETMSLQMEGLPEENLALKQHLRQGIANFIATYADQTERDFRLLEDRVKTGQIATVFE